jgi:RNA polymerase sigma factor (sigma-70 family)
VAQGEKSTTISDFARSRISRVARRMIGHAGIKYEDREDLEQEFVADLLQRLSHFDPKRGNQEAFETTLIKRRAASILRHRRAAKRDYRRLVSLDPLDKEGSAFVAQECGARRGACSRSDQETVELACDVAELLMSLPRPRRDLAERLMYQSVSEIARDMGKPRTTLYTDLGRLRRRFEKAGLKAYL